MVSCPSQNNKKVVNGEGACCVDWGSCAFGGDILNKTLSADVAFQEYKPLVQTFPQPPSRPQA